MLENLVIAYVHKTFGDITPFPGHFQHMQIFYYKPWTLFWNLFRRTLNIPTTRSIHSTLPLKFNYNKYILNIRGSRGFTNWEQPNSFLSIKSQ